jgi:hypothetical protein
MQEQNTDPDRGRTQKEKGVCPLGLIFIRGGSCRLFKERPEPSGYRRDNGI